MAFNLAPRALWYAVAHLERTLCFSAFRADYGC